MRRKLSLLLAIIMLLGILAGCQPKNQGETTDPTETTQEPTVEQIPTVFGPPLSDTDKETLISAYYDWRQYSIQGGYYELAWEDFSDTVEKGCTYSGYRYYSTFGDCVVWFRGGVSGTSTKTEIAGSVFEHPYNADYYVYSNDTLYTLQQAFEQGMISAADVATVAEYHADYNAAAAKNPNAVVMDLSLTPEKELEIKQAFLTASKIEGYTVDTLPLRVISNYEGVYGLHIGPKLSVHDMETSLKLKKPENDSGLTGYYQFFFPSDNPFVVYANNRFYGIEDAWEEGILTVEHVELLLEGNRYLHHWMYPDDWKS